MSRYTGFFLIVILFSAPLLRAADARQADDAYRNGQYAEAIELYEQVLAEGLTSAELHYNLGNAYYRDGQLAQAILNYRRALRLNPAMTDARENLALAESRTTDRIAVLPQFFLVRWVDTLCTAVSPHLWRVIWLVLLALLGVSIVLFRLGESRSLRKTGFVMGIVFLVLLLLASWLLLRSTARYNARSQAVVMPQVVSVKGSPEEESVDKMILHEGTVVSVGDSLSGWYKITIADGTTGWCRSEHVERI